MPAQRTAPALAVLLVLLGIWVATIGNSHSGASPLPAATTSALAPPTSTPDGSCAPQPCANDDYGWILTVSGVMYDAPAGSAPPRAGTVFVTLDVTFTNRLAQAQYASPAELALRDGAGSERSPLLFSAGPCPAWTSTTVGSGATFGPRCLAFEAAAHRPAGLVLLWTPHLLGGDYEIRLG